MERTGVHFYVQIVCSGMASGYECPVCSLPQQDPVHLANHMAMTAILHEDTHHEWLQDTVPGWDTKEPAVVAAEIVAHANETTYPVMFEDTTDSRSPNEHHHESRTTHRDNQDGFDQMTARVIERTREMMKEADDTESSGST